MTMDFHKLLQRKPKDMPNKVSPENYVSTGSTILNLACTGRTDCGFEKGRYYHFVGDSSSGKTFLALTCLAEAAHNPAFDDYDLYHDDAEHGTGFDFEKFFGSKTASRVMPPRGDRDTPIYSSTVEEFYDNLYRILDEGRPIIYIMDSMDVLTTEADDKKYTAQRKVREKKRRKAETGEGETVKEETGSYGMAKAKENSTKLRLAMSKLHQTHSILVIIGQTRDRPGAMSYGDTRTTGGGHALKFYANQQLWTSVKEHIVKPIRGKNREQGIIAKVRIKKNRQTGRDRSALIPIYHSYGIDDVGACIDYLVDEKHWKKGQGGILAPELDLRAPREKLISHVQDNGLEKKVRMTVKKIWNEIETATAIQRKPRYE